VNGHLVGQHGESASNAPADDRRVMIAEQVLRIDVHKDRLMVRFRSAGTEEGSHSTDGQTLSIPWQKPPSRKSRQILIPFGVLRNDVRPTRIERRARLVNAIAQGRRWLDEIVSGSATNIEQIATRQKYSVRQVNMTVSLAFLAPALVKAAVEGRLSRGIGVERLRDQPAEWTIRNPRIESAITSIELETALSDSFWIPKELWVTISLLSRFKVGASP
jgi:site-specific DNA recombinase